MGYDGDDPGNVRLWHTYVYWAKQQALQSIRARGGPVKGQPAIADDPANRIDETLSEAIRTIVFASFMLEYRLRRVLAELDVTIQPKTTLGPLLNSFWSRLKETRRIEGEGCCCPPEEWKKCFPVLQRLVRLRNAIAHANYNETLQIFHATDDSVAFALQHYNAVIDAIRLINVGTGNDTRPHDVLVNYFQPLKVNAPVPAEA